MANTTLRLCKPQCSVDPEWTGEPINMQVKRAIAQLCEATVKPTVRGRRESVEEETKAFPAPTFAYCFYLLKEVLKGWCWLSDAEVFSLRIGKYLIFALKNLLCRWRGRRGWGQQGADSGATGDLCSRCSEERARKRGQGFGKMAILCFLRRDLWRMKVK